MKKVVTIITTIMLLFTALLLFFILFTRIQGKTPELFGYQILRVSSKSMSPELEVGDIILTKRVDDILSLKEGDIIAYKGEVGTFADKIVTHKVIVEPYKSGEGYCLQTMGIANSFVDPEIRDDQVTGKMVCELGILGGVYNFFVTPFGLVAVLLFLAVLFVNEIFCFKQLSLEEKSKEAKERDDGSSGDENSR